MSTIEPRRGRPPRNGGPAAPKPAEPAVPTATQVLARLEAMRHANGGFLIPPPSNLASARLVEPATSDERFAGQAVPNKAMVEATAWLRAIAETGSPEDLRLAWEAGWRLPGGLPSMVNPKSHLLSLYEGLMNECGRRWRVLYEAAEREALSERTAAALRTQLRSEKDTAAAIQREHQQALAKARRTEAELAMIERSGETLQ